MIVLLFSCFNLLFGLNVGKTKINQPFGNGFIPPKNRNGDLGDALWHCFTHLIPFETKADVNGNGRNRRIGAPTPKAFPSVRDPNLRALQVRTADGTEGGFGDVTSMAGVGGGAGAGLFYNGKYMNIYISCLVEQDQEQKRTNWKY